MDHNRREVLQLAGAASFIALAGCSGSNEPDDTENGSGTTTEPTARLTPTPSSESPPAESATPDSPSSDQPKLVVDAGDSDTKFGSSIALEGDTALIGATGRNNSSTGDYAGSAYVFTRSGDTWSQQSELTADDGDSSNQFGDSIALADSTAVIGAPKDDNSNGEAAGSAHVFTRSGDTWSHQGKLIAPDGDSNDDFGRSVALKGDTAVIGAPGDDIPDAEDNTPDRDAGSAYVFTRSGDSWSPDGKFIAYDKDSGDFFGVSVALGDDTVVIGATGVSSSNGNYAGGAYVFTRSDGTWSRQSKLTANDREGYDQFGDPVAVAGDTAVIGVPRDNNANGQGAGSAYVFTRSGDTWSQQTKLTADDGDSDDQFGSSIALSGDTIVIGSLDDENPNGESAGSAYVYTRSGDGWSQQRKLITDDGDSDDQFGSSVGLAGDTTAVGSPHDVNSDGGPSGSVYVFNIV
jgi:hypothetical protein